MDNLLIILIPLLIQVESSGNPDAVGDGGKAVGVLQIHKIAVDDVNRIYGTEYTYQDRSDPVKSRRIAGLYLTHWGKHYEQKTGQKATLEVLSRIWNGGPNGYKKPATIPYWNKVQKAR